MPPKISIVIPSFNKADFIRETLNSIVRQNYSNIEVLIQDGDSTDGTVKIIKHFVAKYPDIISWVSKKDKGQVDAINKGLKKATGDLLTYINADDVYEPGSLRAVAKAYKKNPNTLWFAGKGKVMDKKGHEITRWVTKYKNMLLKLNSYNLLLVTNYLMQPSVFFSKLAYKKYGPFKGVDGTVMEYGFWLKLGEQHMPVIMNEYISSFRLYSEGKSISLEGTLLEKELKLVHKFNNNRLIYILHKMHNVGRLFIAKYY